RLSDCAVQTVAQFLAGLEERNPLFFHVHRFAGTRIAPAAGRAVFHGKCAKATQLHAIAFSKRVCDLVEYRADDVFDIALEEMRIAAGDNLNEFRFDHGFKPLFFCLFRPVSAGYCVRLPGRRQFASGVPSTCQTERSPSRKMRSLAICFSTPSASCGTPIRRAPAWMIRSRSEKPVSLLTGFHSRRGRSLESPLPASQATASSPPPSPSISFLSSAWRPVKTAPLASASACSCVKERRFSTISTNHA